MTRGSRISLGWSASSETTSVFQGDLSAFWRMEGTERKTRSVGFLLGNSHSSLQS